MLAGRVLGLLLGGVFVYPCQGASIRMLEVTLEGDIYRTRAEALLAAPPQRVWKQLTDYDQFERLSPSIERSEVLGRTDQGGYRVRISARACVLYFCKRMQQVQTVRQLGFGRMRSSRSGLGC